MAVRAKVVASTAGAGAGFGAGLVLNWLLRDVAGLDVPDDVLNTFDAWLAAAVAFAAGYWKRETVLLEEQPEEEAA